jgi:hypothetical protein
MWGDVGGCSMRGGEVILFHLITQSCRFISWLRRKEVVEEGISHRRTSKHEDSLYRRVLLRSVFLAMHHHRAQEQTRTGIRSPRSPATTTSSAWSVSEYVFEYVLVN